MGRCAKGGVLLGLWATTLAASACRSDVPGTEAGGADSAAAPAATDLMTSAGPKACDVVSTADLARITGLELEQGVLTNDYGGVSQCRWKRAGGTDNGVTVSVREQGDMGIYTSVPGATAVQGIGDEAVWNPNTHQLAFRVGSRIASMTFLFDEGREQWAREIAGIIHRALAAAPAPTNP
jgi:hypothetical protein